MVFTLNKILDSVTGVLKKSYPDIPVYSNLVQQGAAVPCFFVFFVPTEIVNQMGNRFMRDIGIDIIYQVDKDNSAAYGQMVSAADELDCTLGFIPYSESEFKLRTYERVWEIKEGELHYQVHIKAALDNSIEAQQMESVETYKGGIKNV